MVYLKFVNRMGHLLQNIKVITFMFYIWYLLFIFVPFVIDYITLG